MSFHFCGDAQRNDFDDHIITSRYLADIYGEESFLCSFIRERMSLEALRLVSEYMTPAGRINLAQVDASSCNELIRWEDVHSLLFDDYKVVMAGEVFRHQVESSTDSRDNLQMEQSFRLCPHARHVWIQTRLRNEHVDVLRKRSGLIESLYLSSENFDTRYPLSWDDFTMSRLRSINILQRMDQPLNLRQILDPTACQAFFPITLRHISLTGVVLTPAFMDVLLTLTNLRQLDLIGSVIDSNLAAEYVEKLGRLPNLDEMTMPPSMFSFSNQEQSVVTFSFRKLHLSKLSIYMEQFDENTFFEQLETIMPRKLEALVLYGNFFALKKSKKYGQWRKFEIVFGKMTPQVRTQWWMRDDAILMSHLVRSPPYKTADDFRPIRNSNASWRFDQAVADNEEARQARQNQPLNRILRFMQVFMQQRPEPPAPGVAPQRALPEIDHRTDYRAHLQPPPPPPAARRERARRRASNPPAQAEERRPAPIMFTIPAVDGGNAGPVGVIIPAQAVPDNAAPPAPNPPQEHIREHRPDPNAAQLPAIPEVPPASDLPGTESNRTTPRDAVSSETAPLLAPIQPGLPQPSGNQGNAFPTAIVQPVAHDGNQPPAQSVQIREVPAETPASTNQPQPRVEVPSEIPATASTRSQPRDDEPHLFIANVAPAAEQRPNARAANAPPNPANRPGQAPPAEQRHAEQPDGHADEENINMMLQGMLQALVEEIVFDAVNEEPHRTPAPVTPPPSDASQVSQPPRNRNP
ncbi:unnamed protein product [Haemonchus placei]|uniref:F-box domain-containing protein n=1 Tax=Haemonchus placei TaxID=6290 RepID=A0A0N4WIQ2_HAEPC|nr:unnamed protein product [Haemonchus placei]